MPINVTYNSFADITSSTVATNLNNNNLVSQQAFLAALNSSGDKMSGILDMNSSRIINLPAPTSLTEPARLADVTSTSIGLSLPSLAGVINASSTVGILNTTFSGTGNLPITQLASGSGASSSTFWRGDGSWASPGSVSFTAGTGIVVVSSGTGNTVSVATTVPTSVTSDTNVTGVIATNGLALGWTGTLSLARGGFGTAGTASIGGMVYSVNSTGFAVSTSATTAGQMWRSAVTGTPVLSTAVWPADCSTNQILVSTANHTWSASQTVTNLTLTTPTLTTATLTGTTVMANATLSGNVTFTSGVGVVGATDALTFGATTILGEVLATSVGSGSAIALVNGTSSTIVTFTLSPGDWDGKAQIYFTNNSAGSQVSQLSASITATGSTTVTPTLQGYCSWLSPSATSSFASTGVISIGGMYLRQNTSTSTTLNINALANFTAGSISVWCHTQWRRAR